MAWIECLTLCLPLFHWTQPAEALPPASSFWAAAPVEQRPAPQTASAYPSFNSQQFDQQIQRYLRYLATVGRPDILIVGSSRARWGVDPIVLQRSLGEQGYPNLKIFNFGINGATAKVVDFLLRQFLTPDQLPRVIVWADGVRAFNSGRVDHTHSRIVASQGYKRLTSGIRPVPPPPLDWGQLCIEIPSSSIAHVLTQDKSLSRDRAVSAADTQPICVQSMSKTLERSLGVSALTIVDRREAAGFQPLSARFNPTTYFRSYPSVPGEYDGDYRNFSLEGEQTIALRNVANFARARRIPLIVVSLPLTQVYFDRSRTEYERQFRTFMRAAAKAEQFRFYDLSHRWLSQHDYYIDPSHLNRYGAAAVSQQLAQAQVIPKSAF